ncbi:MAG: flagellar filament capping protein FliD [Clostridia bacterium]|nr:flagellar filament capping protein FliD [Clostridia bacterium]
MSNLRVGGLATGMDLESIVKNLMKIEQLKLDKLEQQKTRIQWQQEAYNDINKIFANFILDVQKEFGLTKAVSTGFTKQPVSSLNWVKTAMSGDETVLTASARANSVSGTHTIEVERLATGWSAASADQIGSENGLISLGAEEAIDFTINGWRFTTKTIEELGGIEQVDLEKYIHISHNDGKVSLSEVANAINKAGIGITAHYDSAIDRFFLQTAGTGSERKIEIEDNSVLAGERAFIADNAEKKALLNLQGKVAELNVDEETGESVIVEKFVAVVSGENYQGQDAIVHFGAARNLKFSSNQFTLNNIDFTIKGVGTTTVTVDTDVDGVYDKIVDFVARYNLLIDKVNNLLTEKVYRDYQPLTKEQREAMSEKEIELWEEKAKSGLLNRDIYLSQTLQRIRSGLYEGVTGPSKKEHHIYNFGISTESYVAGSMGGKLVIDETKLKEAIRNDVDAVLELLFAQPDTSVSEGEARAHTGLVSRIFQDLTEGMKQIINKAGYGGDAELYRKVDSRMLLDFVVEQGSISFLQRDLSRLDERIYNFQAQMLRKENQYWSQFTALEKAINQMNARAAWLAQQLGGGW